MEFASPLAVGFSSDDDVASLIVDVAPNDFVDVINRNLPEGLVVSEATTEPYNSASLMSRYRGASYVCSGSIPKAVYELVKSSAELESEGDEKTLRFRIHGARGVKKLLAPLLEGRLPCAIGMEVKRLRSFVASATELHAAKL